MKNIEIASKKIQLFESNVAGSPLVILHTVHGEGADVYAAVKNLTDADFSFAAIDVLNWDDEMSPWAIPALFKGDTPCTGGADKYLETLIENILPEILKNLDATPKFITLCGYSLAGLFAVYATYRTDIFSRIASASGSFWYPNFLEYVKTHEMRRAPEFIYFSLGDKESAAKNKILQTVEKNTRNLQNWYKNLGVETVFELNRGNHFQDTANRMAKGIARILPAV